jgi:membrane protease YdiL (CAAX protease family)
VSRPRDAVIATLRLHVKIIRRNWLAAICSLVTSAAFLSVGVYRNIRALVGYALALWLGAFFTDFAIAFHPKPGGGFPIKRPPWQESLLVLAFTCAAFVPLSVRFSHLWPIHNAPARAVFAAAMLFFTLGAGLACIYLFVYRYRLTDLGVNFRYWYVALAVHILFGVITLAFAPQKSHWQATFRADGVWGTVVEGVLTAAIPEEFLRMLLMTRLGAVFSNKGMGLFVATFLWASLHIPVFWSGVPQWSFWRALISPWGIIPIGLLWGYITHRTRSLVPSVLLHGFNLWGLQNF